MAALFNAVRLMQRLNVANPPLMQLAARNLAAWNKDYKPAQFPATPKEREEAAKKYNLLPEEYKPYADDGLGLGDYPDLGHSWGIESKDNYYPYDYPEHKRNFNEIIHAEIDFYGEDRYSQPDPLRYPMSTYFQSFIGVMAVIYFIYWWLDDKRMFRPVAAKQYPKEGVTHYTFEVEENQGKKK